MLVIPDAFGVEIRVFKCQKPLWNPSVSGQRTWDASEARRFCCCPTKGGGGVGYLFREFDKGFSLRLLFFGTFRHSVLRSV